MVVGTTLSLLKNAVGRSRGGAVRWSAGFDAAAAFFEQQFLHLMLRGPKARLLGIASTSRIDRT